MYSNDVEFKHIPGAIPELVLFNAHEEVNNKDINVIIIIIPRN